MTDRNRKIKVQTSLGEAMFVLVLDMLHSGRWQGAHPDSYVNGQANRVRKGNLFWKEIWRKP